MNLADDLDRLAGEATPGPLSLIEADTDDEGEARECRTVLDAEGHDILNGGCLENADAALWVFLRNHAALLAAAVRVADLYDGMLSALERRRAKQEKRSIPTPKHLRIRDPLYGPEDEGIAAKLWRACNAYRAALEKASP